MDETKSADAMGILPEAPENCGHGKHKNYYQGVLSYNYKSGKNEKYLIIDIKLPTENQLKNIDLVNTNEERLKVNQPAQQGVQE